MGPDSLLPVTGKTTDSEDGDNHPTVKFPAMVLNHLGSTGRPSSSPPSKSGPGNPPKRSGIYHAIGSPGPSCMAHLRESFTSQGLSTAA